MGEADPTEKQVEEEYRYGIALEAFNMREELDFGVVDPLSGVVNTKKTRGGERIDQLDEPWLLDFDEKMKDKNFAARFREQSQLDQDKPKEPEVLEPLDKSIILNEIANILLWGETVNTAIRRLRPQKQSTKKISTNDDAPPPMSFNEFLEKVDRAVGIGITSIYSMAKEDILDLLDSDRRKYPIWEYKWSGDDTVYGPHSTEEMAEWMAQGYFNVEGDSPSLVVRKNNSEEFVSISTVDFAKE